MKACNWLLLLVLLSGIAIHPSASAYYASSCELISYATMSIGDGIISERDAQAACCWTYGKAYACYPDQYIPGEYDQSWAKGYVIAKVKIKVWWTNPDEPPPLAKLIIDFTHNDYTYVKRYPEYHVDSAAEAILSSCLHLVAPPLPNEQTATLNKTQKVAEEYFQGSIEYEATIEIDAYAIRKYWGAAGASGTHSISYQVLVQA